MVYNLIITERAEELLDNLIYHLLYNIKSQQAAVHLMNGIDRIYNRLEENPYQFPECRDFFLKSKGYREAIVADMNYLLIVKVENENVYVMGVFHGLENYKYRI